MADLEYITSERFIHDDICREAKAGIKTLYKSWAKDGCIYSFIMVWPSERIRVRGKSTEHAVHFVLPKEREYWSKYLIRLVQKTAAYALLLVEQRKQAVVVIVESNHGSKSWHIPIENHGDTLSLGKPEERVDTDAVGLLWRPNKASA